MKNLINALLNGKKEKQDLIEKVDLQEKVISELENTIESDDDIFEEIYSIANSELLSIDKVDKIKELVSIYVVD